MTCGQCTIAGLLKAAGITLREDYTDPMEQLLDYMELVRCYEREKLFVFVNLRSFFPDEADAVTPAAFSVYSVMVSHPKNDLTLSL